ncbi:MAG TPA: hypothetical protein VE263_03800 [Candidatus Angelobacter sp.]|nr:hypothetical protein [Candidatus Angelobacter sp.]
MRGAFSTVLPIYQTVFDITQQKLDWLLILYPAICAIIAMFLFPAAMRRSQKIPKRAGKYVVLVCVAAAVFFTYAMYQDQRVMASQALGIYRSGRVQVVEGVVEDFVRMRWWGGPPERFRVGKFQFSYSDYLITGCFRNTSSHGGPVRAGQHVSIAFNGNCILKMQIAKDVSVVHTN